jgi:hypothetical protein
MKLTIELVPSTVWNSSLYSFFKNTNQEEIWREIKKKLFEKEKRKCWICGNSNRRLEAHEFWNYDDVNKIQKLENIHHLCDLCHKVKHIGRWLFTYDGEKDLKKQKMKKEDIIRHFCKVNNCSNEDLDKYLIEVFKIHSKRSKFDWQQDFGIYNDKIRKILFL